ncbi:MAG: hypothetical protein O6940_00565 [Ignavibacteria bacterium]|nr:hypothetical protein [Ignavibacteria bacterium]
MRPGYVSETAKESGAYPVGIDFSLYIIHIARKRNPELEFYVEGVENLNIESGSFYQAGVKIKKSTRGMHRSKKL